MKRFFITAAIVAIFSIAAHAQKYALVDMEYILKNIPQYEMANEQLNQVSLRWQKEVEAKSKEAETLYKNYQSDMVFLTDEQKKKKEEHGEDKVGQRRRVKRRHLMLSSLSNRHSVSPPFVSLS